MANDHRGQGHDEGDALPWERQPGEGPKPWQAFEMYLAMGPQRGLREVARQLHKSLTIVGRWSGQWHWIERVAEWEQEQHRHTLAELDDARRDMVVRHARISSAILTKVAQRVIGDETSGIPALDPAELSAADVGRLLDIAVKNERLSRGVPASVSQIQHELPGGTDPEYVRSVLANPAARSAALALSAALNGEDGGWDEDDAAAESEQALDA
jgi:hypothetical protein